MRQVRQSSFAALLIVLTIFVLSHVASGQRTGVVGTSEPDALCGPRSLLAVCQRLGVEAKLDELKNLSGFDEKAGTTMLGLKEAAEANGLHAVGMKISLDELVRCEAAAIAHLWGNHFVVVESAGTDTLKVTNPPGKPKTVPRQDFAKAYSGFALLIAKEESAFPQPEANGPDLRFDSHNYDFGFIEQGAQAAHTFVYENKGNEELVISKAETTCGCTRAFLSEETRVPPGGKGELLVGFDSTGRQGGQSQTVYVHSNDPISPVVQLQIAGVIKPVRLPISVRGLHFGAVKKRGGATKEFSIKDPGDGSLEVTEVTSDSPFMKVSLSSRIDKPIVYLVKAALEPGAPIGELKCKITVRSNHPKEPVVEIPVAADVRGDVEAFPNMFFLGLLKKGQGATKTISLSTTSDEPLRIERLDSPFDYIVVKLRSEVENRKYAVTATLKETAPLGLIKAEVVIHTNNKDQPEIKLPLYALVEE